MRDLAQHLPFPLTLIAIAAFGFAVVMAGCVTATAQRRRRGNL